MKKGVFFIDRADILLELVESIECRVKEKYEITLRFSVNCYGL